MRSAAVAALFSCFCLPALAQPALERVDGIEVRALGNPVEAREKAWEDAWRTAARTVASRHGIQRPNLDSLAYFSVAKESVGPGGYVAVLDVTVDLDRLRRIEQPRLRYATPPPDWLLLVPIFRSTDEIHLFDRNQPWLTAWRGSFHCCHTVVATATADTEDLDTVQRALHGPDGLSTDTLRPLVSKYRAPAYVFATLIADAAPRIILEYYIPQEQRFERFRFDVPAGPEPLIVRSQQATLKGLTEVIAWLSGAALPADRMPEQASEPAPPSAVPVPFTFPFTRSEWPALQATFSRLPNAEILPPHILPNRIDLLVLYPGGADALAQAVPSLASYIVKTKSPKIDTQLDKKLP